MSGFDAFRVFDEGGTINGRVVQLTLADLSEGAVVIKTAFSSVNYKDALAATGAGKIMRRFPLVGGIDLAGEVTSSSVAAVRVGRRGARRTATTSAWRTTAATPNTCARRRTGSCRCRGV